MITRLIKQTRGTGGGSVADRMLVGSSEKYGWLEGIKLFWKKLDMSIK